MQKVNSCVLLKVQGLPKIYSDKHVYMKGNVHVFDNIKVTDIFTFRNVYFFNLCSFKMINVALRIKMIWATEIL